MRRNLIHFFDKLEDKIRARLSHHPILYAFIGGTGVVLFWKGVWETAEHIPQLNGIPSIVLGLLLILPTGLFVSFFIGDNIILSGYKKEKKMIDRTESEILREINTMGDMTKRIERIEVIVKNIEYNTLPAQHGK